MAKSSPTEAPAATTPAKPKRKPVDRLTRQNANLLRSIADCYRDAATALTSGNMAAYNNALNVAGKYQGLIEALNESANDAANADALAHVLND